MRQYAFIITFSAGSAISSQAQTNWVGRQDSLYRIYRAGGLQEQQWWHATRAFAGFAEAGTDVWVKDTGSISPDFLKHTGAGQSGTGTRLFIAGGGRKNNKGYMPVYLLNESDTIACVPRKDATVSVRAIKACVFLDGQWIRIHDEYAIPGCGRGYFTALLPPGRYFSFDVNSPDDVEGEITVPYKIVIRISGRPVASNAVPVRLFPNQLQRIRDNINLQVYGEAKD